MARNRRARGRRAEGAQRATAVNPLDALLPRFDASDAVECTVPGDLRAAAWALQTYDLRAHAGLLSRVLERAHVALPTPPPQSVRLAQLGHLSAVAMEEDVGGQRLLFGFIGHIWRPGALLKLPAAGDFVSEAAKSPDAACVLWRLEVAPHADGEVRLRLAMRLRYPVGIPARWWCAAYWRSVRGMSVWARRQLLRSIAQHARRAPHGQGSGSPANHSA